MADRNGLIRQYLINITEIDTRNVFSYFTMTTEFNAGFFHPYYYYSCSVSAVTIAPGPYTDPVIIQTRIDGIYTLYTITLHEIDMFLAVPSGPPQSTDTLSLSSTSLLLTWDGPLLEQQNGPIVGYSVRVVRVDDSSMTDIHTNDTMLRVDSLDPHTLYEWRVAARTITGTGPYSSPVVEQTLPDGK